MTISYKWLCEYLPFPVDPEKLSGILTSIGLEVESMEKYEDIKGGLKGLIVGEVVHCEKHPEADKLKLTKVNIGSDMPLNIVCGAPNVAVGQKVIVAPVGCTIYPIKGEPFTLKKAKIRGAESEGMLCAEDEVGIGESHDGIKILNDNTIPGSPVADLFDSYDDIIYEIGLTPNRMDAMSHLGVARDVCAYLSYHEQQQISAKLPYPADFKTTSSAQPFEVRIENENACKRYGGIYISGIEVKESPSWLQQRLKAIGQKPINNIVDITNYILHETGQPLHAFDADKIQGHQIIVKTASEGEIFKTLDEKDRKLSNEDLMICDAEKPMCMAGVYGGWDSGVSATTKSIFLESACFDGTFVRKTSIRHGLRTDAATRFEKGVDISNTIQVLQRAALLMTSIGGGEIASTVTDVFPGKKEKTALSFSYDFLRKLSGKTYPAVDVKRILTALGFEIKSETPESIELLVPFSKSDISIQADIVEEIMRIDGLDNIIIPNSITIAPSVERSQRRYALREKMANTLAGAGFHEIFTNSITNSAFYDENILKTSVKMINSLSNELDMLRPRMIQSGLQVIAHNLNHRNQDLPLFEFGKTYFTEGENKYGEENHLAVYLSGNVMQGNWKAPAEKSDYYFLKGIIQNIAAVSGIKNLRFETTEHAELTNATAMISGKETIGYLGEVSSKLLKQFDIKQSVFFADIHMDALYQLPVKPIQYREISKFPSVNRDLALVVDKNVSYSQIEQIALSAKVEQLRTVELFDIFESEKLGVGKKSMAVSFTFLDEQKTMTDQEIEGFMKKIIGGYEKTLQAEIRK